MLVLSRKIGEQVVLGDSMCVTVTVLAIHGNRVRLGFSAPEDVSICREELLGENPKPHQAKKNDVTAGVVTNGALDR